MGFKLIKYNNGRDNVGPFTSYEAASNEEIKAGEALVLAAGKLTKCGPTTAPQFISMTNLAKAETNRVIHVNKVNEDQVWRVACTSDPTALKPGDKVTLSDDALMLTATTTSGVATVEQIDEVEKELLVRLKS